MTVEEYISAEGLNTKSRRRDIVYRRMYLFKYLKQMQDKTLTEIGNLFNRDHSTIIHGLKTFEDVKLYDDFIDYTQKEFELFRIDTFRRDLRTLNRIPVQFSREEFETIAQVRIENNLENNHEAVKFIIQQYER